MPWLRSTGPKTPDGKAVVAKNAYRGGVRPQRRAARRECKASIEALDHCAAWEEMEARIDAWLHQQRLAGKRPTDAEMRRAGLKSLPLPCVLPADLMADVLASVLAPLAGERDHAAPRRPR